MEEKRTMSEVISVIKIIARPEKRRELFLTISSLLNSIRDEKGCHGYRFYGEADEQDSFLLVGEWDTGTDLHRHLKSEQFTILLGSLGLLTKEESLDFKLLSEVAGLEVFIETGMKNKGA